MNKRFVITELIRSLAIPANLKGYHVLRDALEIAIEQPKMLHKMSSHLYVEVAKRQDTLPSRVDRNLRYIVEVASVRNSEEFQRLFGRQESLPTVGEFLGTLVDELREFRLVSSSENEVAR